MYEEIFNQIRSAANKRNLKDSTIHAYCTSVAHFLNHTAKDIDALTTDDVDTFLTEKKLSGISPETYNHYHSGIRFFYKKVLKMNWDDDDIPRMKRDRKLPAVLTKAEISAILDATPNLKHKAMIATMYSGGLRVSEVTHLHYDDISRTNKTIHIRDGKSRSDRYTLLADRTLEILTEYWFQCGRPRGILFPSSWTGDYLTKDSVNPFLFRKLLAHGTASASAGVVVNTDTSAVLTNTDVYTKNSCFTVSDVISRFSVMSRRVTPLFIGRIEPFKYILYRT